MSSAIPVRNQKERMASRPTGSMSKTVEERDHVVIRFASTDITTPGDHADVLVAMNPAALRADLDKVARGGTIIVNEDSFTQRNLEKAGYASDPTTDGTLDGYQIYPVP